MIISRAEIRSAVSAYRSVKRKSLPDQVRSDVADRFEPSADAESLLGFVQSATAEPFYRTVLVETLGRRIAQGRYHVSSDEIVERLLGRLIVEFAQA